MSGNDYVLEGDDHEYAPPTVTRAEAEARLTDEVLDEAGEMGDISTFDAMRQVILTAIYGPKAETPTKGDE